MEIAGLKQGVEAYKLARNDYPPNFSEGDYKLPAASNSVLRRHLVAVYPKINPAHLATGGTGPIFSDSFANSIDEAETLVFWLSYTMDDVREPIAITKSGTEFNFPKTRKVFFEFDQKRLVDYDNDGFYAYKPKYAKDTHYVYFDSRSYGITTVKYDSQYPGARPYFAANGTANPTAAINPTGFQIICAGRDGEFGPVPMSGMTAGRKDITFGANGKLPKNIDVQSSNSPERDNLTSFSEGLLENLLP
jgi:hypothetical protein